VSFHYQVTFFMIFVLFLLFDCMIIYLYTLVG